MRNGMLAASLLLAGSLSGCMGTSVPAGDRGLRWLPLGEGVEDKVYDEGYYIHLPWNDYIVYDVRWKSAQEKVEVLTKDDLHIKVDASVIVRPKIDELRALALQTGPNYYEAVVRPAMLTTVRGQIAHFTMIEVPKRSAEIEKAIQTSLSEQLAPLHVEVARVTLDHVDLTPTVLRAIESKLATEQGLMQKDFELQIASKDADIVRTRAKGEADASKTLAEGQSAAIKIRAEGQAAAQKSITATLTADYLRYKAFDSPNAKFYFLPIGKDGLPLIVAPSTGEKSNGVPQSQE